MSKHDKHVRRERKKTDRARRRRSFFRHPTSHIPHAGAAALAAAAAIAAGTAAYADPVRFDNPAGPGHFVWASVDYDNAKWLDLTLDAASQPGGVGPDGSTAASFWHFPADYGGVHNNGADFPDGANVIRDGYALVGLSAGDIVAPSGTQQWYRYGFVEYAGYGPLIPEGEPSYLGIRFDVGSGTHYGWIGVDRAGMELDAFAWGYETDVGVSIPAGAIPEPGSLALLAFGALAVCRRRP